MNAAEFAGASGFISRLESGYDTVLGKWFEKGTELSVGEWQKVALARAFIRDSQIIILDEPTSSLDPHAEDEVIRKFKDLAKGKMALIISHRLSTASVADRIYVLNAGRVVESGTHRELMDKGGRYASMFEVQGRHYRKN
jgi:ATP-binding cassette subfamily B protein